MPRNSAGARFRAAIEAEKPLQIIGAVNAYHALMAQDVGFKALYLSGGALSAGSLGLPDLAISSLADVLIDLERITYVCDLPVLVDVDTGFGPSGLNIERTVKSLIRSGAAGLHIEDQPAVKRASIAAHVKLVSTAEMVDRIKAAVDARNDPDFAIMARTDAFAGEGLEATLDRARAYVEAGADMILPEALPELAMMKQFADTLKVPILAGFPEFGVTPLFTPEELRSANVAMAMYPLSAFRAMNAAALKVMQTIRTEGTAKNALDMMQTRQELYKYLNYDAYESRLGPADRTR